MACGLWLVWFGKQMLVDTDTAEHRVRAVRVRSLCADALPLIPKQRPRFECRGSPTLLQQAHLYHA